MKRISNLKNLNVQEDYYYTIFLAILVRLPIVDDIWLKMFSIICSKLDLAKTRQVTNSLLALVWYNKRL